MHPRRLATFLLGAWLLGILFLHAAATQNIRSVDRTLRDPGERAQKMLDTLGPVESRQLLRFQASQANRHNAELWEWVQVGLGSSLLVLLLLAVRSHRMALALATALILIVLAQRLWLTPLLSTIGRQMDFLADPERSPFQEPMTQYHSYYSALEWTKLALIVGLAGLYVLQTSPRRRARHGSRAPAEEALSDS